ncbi:unnamed protein product, partial [Adineta steineri]
NDAIPCLKLDFKNRNDLHLHDFLELFNIKQIRMNDLNLADEKSSPAEYFRIKLIEISPFLKKWLKCEGVSTNVISLIDQKLQQEYDLIESDNLQLFYHKIFVRETTVYFDNKRKQLYVKRPWDSETTFIDLPNKLCQLLNIQGFEKNIRFLLKGTIEEIKKHFHSNSIEIPTQKDIVILKLLPKTDVLQQPKFSLTSESKPNTSLLPVKNVKSTETSITNNNDHLLVLTPQCQVVPQHYQIPFYDAIPALLLQLPIQNMRTRKENEERLSTSVFIGSSENSVDDIEFIDICSITNSSLMSFTNLNHITGECDASDLDTGRIGEEMKQHQPHQQLLPPPLQRRKQHRLHPPPPAHPLQRQKLHQQLLARRLQLQLLQALPQQRPQLAPVHQRAQLQQQQRQHLRVVLQLQRQLRL